MVFSQINPLIVADFPLWDFHEPLIFNPGSFALNPSPIAPNSVPDEPNRKIPKTSPSAGPRLAANLDDRRRRRMKSNRESARRSRVKKHEHLEELTERLDRLGIENRELTDRFRLAAYRDKMVRLENEQFQSEAAVLQGRLWELRQVLVVRLNPSYAWPCNNNFTYINEEQSMINSLIA